jgi:hypothetical protein
MSDIPLPDIKLEDPRYVAMIIYQKPIKIVMGGRRKASPRFETMYGLLYWLNKQPYSMEYIIYRTDKNGIIREGFKKAEEKLV